MFASNTRLVIFITSQKIEKKTIKTLIDRLLNLSF